MAPDGGDDRGAGRLADGSAGRAHASPPPPHSSQPAGVFSPFRVRGYRFLWSADLLVASAMEMEVLILGWYVLTTTGSVLLLTALGSVQHVGSLLAPVAGAIGDRFGLRQIGRAHV